MSYSPWVCITATKLLMWSLQGTFAILNADLHLKLFERQALFWLVLPILDTTVINLSFISNSQQPKLYPLTCPTYSLLTLKDSIIGDECNFNDILKH